MRRGLTLVAVAGLAVAAFYTVILIASESGEVVTFRTSDARGDWHATRLWVVDHAGAPWVRAGNPDRGWFLRAQANPEVELERGGATSAYRAMVVRDAAISRAVNEAFARKYGAADWIVGLSGDTSERVVLRLDPAPR